jgi:hypothetical protein
MVGSPEDTNKCRYKKEETEIISNTRVGLERERDE